MAVVNPQYDVLGRGPSGGSDLWDKEQAGVVLSADYFEAPSSGGSSLPVGLATETDTALGLALASGAGRASETDVAIGRGATLGAGRSSETDTALGRGLTAGAGRADETDTAFAMAPSSGAVVLPVGLAVETDAAFALDVTGLPAVLVPLSLFSGGGTTAAPKSKARSRLKAPKIEKEDPPPELPLQPVVIPVGLCIEHDEAAALIARLVFHRRGGLLRTRSPEAGVKLIRSTPDLIRSSELELVP